MITISMDLFLEGLDKASERTALEDNLVFYNHYKALLEVEHLPNVQITIDDLEYLLLCKLFYE